MARNSPDNALFVLYDTAQLQLQLDPTYVEKTQYTHVLPQKKHNQRSELKQHNRESISVELNTTMMPLPTTGFTGFRKYVSHRESPSLLFLLLISSPRLPVQMAWAAQWAAMGPLLSTMLPPFAVQLTQIIGPVTGILVAPTIGVMSDGCSHRWGRRRPFLVYAGIMTVLCWMLMGFTKEIGEALGDYGTGKEGQPTSRLWTTILTIMFYTWMDVTVNIVQTPALLLISDFAGDRQTIAASFGQSWSSLGSIAVAAYIFQFGPAYNSLKTFLAMLSATMIITITIVFYYADEVRLAPEGVEFESFRVRLENAFGSIYEGLATLPRQLAIYAMVLFFAQYGFTAYNSNKGEFFGQEVFHGDANGADMCEKTQTCTYEQVRFNKGVALASGPIDLVFNILSCVFMFLLPVLVREFGAKSVISFAILPQVLLMVMAFSDIVLINVTISILTFLSGGTLIAMLVPVVVYVIGDDGDIGMYVGALNSSNCFGQLLNFFAGAGLIGTSYGYGLPMFVGGLFSLFAVITSCFLQLEMNYC